MKIFTIKGKEYTMDLGGNLRPAEFNKWMTAAAQQFVSIIENVIPAQYRKRQVIIDALLNTVVAYAFDRRDGRSVIPLSNIQGGLEQLYNSKKLKIEGN